jgi:glycosyltransferase involved in cell wall biosynthesis
MSNLALRPRMGGGGPLYWRRERILLVCFYDPNGISTIWENIRLWQRFSRFEIEVLNLWPGGGAALAIPAGVELDDFAGLIIHPTVAYNPTNLFGLDRLLSRRLCTYEGVKVLAKQDEHYRSAEWPRFVREAGVDLLLTCIPEAEQPKVYHREQVGDAVQIMQTLTGYVTPFMCGLSAPRLAERRLDVSYRGSVQPISFGRLGIEKRKIGSDVALHPATGRLATDISSRWEDRINGKDWYDFLASSRLVLGVESGSNLFDFDGTVERLCSDFAMRNAEMDPLSEAYYLKAEAEFLHRYEGNVRYAQVSPRHFEAAASGAVQLLYEGTYSGIFQPGRHYLPLRRDLSNLEEALDTALSAEGQRIADAALQEIIHNPRHHHETFVQAFDERFAALSTGRRRGGKLHAMPAWPPERVRALVLCSHDPVQDPRIEWFAAALESAGCDVCELGSFRWYLPPQPGPLVTTVSPNRMRVQVERTAHGRPFMAPIGDDATWTAPGATHMARLELLAAAAPEVLARTVGAQGATPDDHARFVSLCRYMANTNSALLQAGMRSGPFDLIVAADLEALPAAVALRHAWPGARLIFDSHEFWPFSYLDFKSWECAFWSDLEGALVQHTDHRCTVSTPLAAQLSAEYGLPFACLPNAVLRADGEGLPTRLPGSNSVVQFLFQGNFAPGRGLEQIVDAWPRVRPDAVLVLRGPENSYRRQIQKRARALGLLGTRVLFPDAVPEAELVARAVECDIGVIPYEPHHYASRFACPNKLSQYMAASRPILTNRLEYVEGIVTKNGFGWSVAFEDQDALVAAIDRCVAERAALPDMGARARRYFEDHFHWEVAAGPFIQDIVGQVKEGLHGRERPAPDLDALLADRSLHRQPAPPSAPGRPPDTANWPLYKVTARALWRLLPVRVRYRAVAIYLHFRTR